eukprot:1481009-Pyramimonas_sp.AAC.1
MANSGIKTRTICEEFAVGFELERVTRPVGINIASIPFSQQWFKLNSGRPEVRIEGRISRSPFDDVEAHDFFPELLSSFPKEH